MEKIRKSPIDSIKVIDTTDSIARNSNVCPVCQYLARDREDIVSIKKEGACTECVSNFKMLMKDEWKKGERPTTKVARKRMNIFIGEVQHETT